MKLRAKRVLDELLSAEEPCLGAAFCSYTFDPSFFEEQVLRVLLRLRSDPEEHASTFHEEARRGLQECPVAVLVDASMRQAGRRLPYDQLLIRSRTFHPKLVLALYAEHARILIGSANLTRGGYDENLELLHARSLRYDDAGDAATLLEVDHFLAGCAALAEAPGTQLQLVRDELARRLPASTPRGSPGREHVLLSSLERPILDQLFDRVPEDASITRVGVRWAQPAAAHLGSRRAELFRTKSRTHKAAVQINMVSSYAAAREGAVLSEEIRARLDEDTECYRRLLREVLEGMGDGRGGHPKLDFVVSDAIEAAERGDKTLIFCTRIATLQELRRQLEWAWMERLIERWRGAYPDASRETLFDTHEDEDRVRGRHSKLQLRFQRTQDALYLALRERYLHTVVSIGRFGLDHADAIVARANGVLRAQRVSGTRAQRFDWALAKRCLEHAAAHEWAERGTPSPDEAAGLERLMSPDFVRWGFDVDKDDLEPDEAGDRAPEWTISTDVALCLLRPEPHLWAHLESPLRDVPADTRVRAIERLARYLTRREVPFLADLLTAAKRAGLDVEHVQSRALLDFVDRFWTTPEGRPWCDLLRRFLAQFGKLRSLIQLPVAQRHVLGWEAEPHDHARAVVGHLRLRGACGAAGLARKRRRASRSAAVTPGWGAPSQRRPPARSSRAGPHVRETPGGVIL